MKGAEKRLRRKRRKAKEQARERARRERRVFVKDDILERLHVPDEPGQWIDVRQLGFVALQQVRDARQEKGLATARQLGPEFMQTANPNDPEVKKQLANPLNNYDREALITESVVAWSYELEVTPENIARMDEQTATWLFGKLVALYHPELADPDGGEQVKDSRPSTTSLPTPKAEERPESGLSA
jgi:hypothetical protein